MMSFLYAFVHTITTPIRAFYYVLSELNPGFSAVSRWSLAFKWALLSLTFLLIIWFAAFIKHWLDVDRSAMDWLKWDLIALPFLCVIPFLVFYFVKYLMMVEVSRYPDIDRIWTESIRDAANKGIFITNTPLFLVLGVSKQREASTVVNLMGLDFTVHVPSAGESPISVHACSQGFFVFLNQCNCVSRLSMASTVASVASPIKEDSGIPPTEVSGTIDANQFGAMRFPMSVSAAASPVAHSSPIQPGGTMLLDESHDLSEFWKTAVTSKQLASQDVVDCEDRMRHVCKLIRNSRLPLCPINGIVSTLPFELVESSSGQLQIAIQKDLTILRQELQVRCPNTALVTGMESEDGFIELIKRLPPSQSSENRFGKGCDLWVAPEAGRLDAIAIHATAAFEDWIYMLFQEENALKKQHNSRLFMMLCRVRGVFAENLRSVISRGFGYDPKIEPHLAYEQFLFGGCYFAATGSGPTQQAFVKSVFAKTLQQEGELEWAPAARRVDNYYHFLANLAALCGTIALIAIAAMLVHRFAIMPGQDLSVQ